MELAERLALITRNTQEVITNDELAKLLHEKKHPSVYIGTAITGRPHVAYFIWVLKIADFLRAGVKAKILLADLHGALDNTPWDLLEKRYLYYERVISAMFDALEVDRTNLTFVRGSSFQLTPQYFNDVLRVATAASVNDCTRAGSEVVKQSENPKLAGLIYPIMQALDEQYLGVDIQYGGVDQRKILVFAREQLPKVGYAPRVELMTPIIPGLIGEKMSASKEESKIDLLDDPKTVEKKLSKAFCPEGVIEGNRVLAFLKYVVMVLKADRGETFVIERPEKFGGKLEFSSYEELEAAFVEKKVHPMDVKAALAREVNALLKPIHVAMQGHEKLITDAYP